MRRPGKALRDMGAGKFLALQLTLGVAILSALVHGPWAIWFALMIFLTGQAIAPAFLWVAAVSYGAGILMAVAAPGEKTAPRLILAMTLPAYWPLQSIAMARALYSLARRPHFWAKTPHGAEAPAPVSVPAHV